MPLVKKEKPILEDHLGKLTFLTSTNMKKRLKKYCFENDITMTEVVNTLLDKFLPRLD